MNIAANANRPRQDRAFLRSCEPCRTAKAKCVPVADPSVRECERCVKYHKNCVYAEAQPRPKRGKQTHTRVAEVEKKLDNIYALLQANRHPENEATSTTTTTTKIQGQVPSPASSTEYDGGGAGGGGREGAQSPFVPRAAKPDSVTHAPVPPSDCRGELRRRLDVIDKGVLTMQEAEDLLRIYHDASRDYPFIYVGPTTSLEMLRWEKPFLMLSILVMASVRVRSLQVLLEKELRELLASKVIVEGELSLDLLQGLLIYLAWYHFNFRPCRQQVYQLTQLAVSMVVDLEINRPSKEKTGFVLHPVRACLACKKDTAVPITSEIEAKRTFVGAWYLTSALSTVLRKPNGMAYTRYIEQCCLDLAEAKEAPMDEHLIHYIRIQRLAEEVGIMFGYSDFGEEARLSPERIQLSVRAFMANLKEIERSFPPEVAAMPSISSISKTTATYIHEVILHIDVDKAKDPSSPQPTTTTTTNPLDTPFSVASINTNANTNTTTTTSGPSSSSSLFPNPHLTTWLHSSTRTDLLLGCLDSLKTALQFFAALPLATFETFTLLDLSRLSYNLLLLARLTLSGGPGFDANVFAETADVIAYFDAFNDKFGALVGMQGGEPSRSFYWHFQRIFRNARKFFGGRIALQAQLARGEGAGGKDGAGAGAGGGGARGGKGTNDVLSPLSLLDPDEEEAMCRRFKALHPDAADTDVAAAMEAQAHGQHGHDGVVNGSGAAVMPGGTPGVVLGPEGTPVVDMEGVLGMGDGLWEEMMAVWPMSMDGSVLF